MLLTDLWPTEMSTGATAATEINSATAGTLVYADLLKLWASLAPYQPNVMIAAADTIQDIMGLTAMQDAEAGLSFHGTGKVVTPLGAQLILNSSVTSKKIIGLDRNFALQMIQSGNVMVEYDKVIEKQLEKAAISVTAGFSRLFKDAVKVLSYASTGAGA